MKYDADVAVIGTGTMGSMTAWQLARRGTSVVSFEQFAPGHDRSGAGGETRIFRTAYKEGAAYVPILQSALEEWRALERQSGQELLTLNGGLMIGRADSSFITEVLRCAEEYRLDCELLDRAAMRARYPQHVLADGEVAVLDRAAGFLRPELAVATAARAAEALGGRIVTDTKVLGIEAEDAGVTVKTSESMWRVRKAVVAAGAWTNDLLMSRTPKLQIQRLIMTWFHANDLRDFRTANFPIFIHETKKHDISGWPSLDGSSIKVAVNVGWDVVNSADELDHNIDFDRLSIIREAVTDLLPSLSPNPVRATAYMDAYTPDKHAVIGPVGGMSNVIALSGFSGHGFKMSSAIGRVAAELTLDGHTDLPVEHLSPSRFAQAEEKNEQ